MGRISSGAAGRPSLRLRSAMTARVAYAGPARPGKGRGRRRPSPDRCTFRTDRWVTDAPERGRTDERGTTDEGGHGARVLRRPRPERREHPEGARAVRHRGVGVLLGRADV